MAAVRGILGWRVVVPVVAICAVVVSSVLPVSAAPGPGGSVAAALPPCTSAPFVDVSVDHPFCAEITWAATAEITTGYPDGSFRPSGLVARQAVAAFLWRLDGSKAPSCGAPVFADVDASHPFFAAIQWMAQTGLSTGSPNPSGGKPLFKPQDPITRAAMAAFLWRLKESPTPVGDGQVFADVDASHPFFAAIQWMGQTGLSNGSPNPFGGKPLYVPSDPITRQAAVAFLARFDSLDEPVVPVVPGKPRNVVAAAGDRSVTVSWSAPANDGGSPITSYVVAASPGGKTCAWNAGPLTCTVTGLTNGQTYTFTVRAHNGVGDGPVSSGAGAAPSDGAIRLFYVRPSDVSATAARPTQIIATVTEVRRWFGVQLDGLAPRVTSLGGVPAVTSAVLPWTQAQISGLANPQASIGDHLASVYGLGGQHMAVWLEGAVNENYCGVWNGSSLFMPMDNCDGIYPSESARFPYGSTYLLAHELTHALGAVPRSCAPHHDGTGHVNDDPRDLLYYGPLIRDWNNLMLDPGRDDYLTPSNGPCPSILDSPHLGPLALP